VSAVLAAWWLNQTPPIGVIPGIALILIGCILILKNCFQFFKLKQWNQATDIDQRVLI
jgi:hypothetical protein